MKELHFTTYTDYETIAAWSNTYIHTKQTPRSLFSSSSLLLLFSLVTVEWKYVKSGKTRIHTHLKIYYQHHFDFFHILFFFFSFVYSHRDNQLHIEKDATSSANVVVMCLCLSTKHHFFYRYVISAFFKYGKRLLLLFFLCILWRKKYVNELQIV